MKIDKQLFASVALQLLANNTSVNLGGDSVPIRRTSTQRLKMVSFKADGREYTAIEQNPDKPSRWGQLARAGHHVVQFKENDSNRFVAVVVDGEVHEYSERSA